MAIIYSYPNLANLASDDLLLVSDSSATGKPTKNITVGQIVDLIPSIVPGGGTVTSVELSPGTTGLTVAASNGNPITTNGIFTLGGQLEVANGGTGQNTYTAGDILYANATPTLAKRNIGGVGEVLTVSAGLLPVWSAPTTGTVSSVQLSIASGMGLTWTVVAGANPITSTGNLELGGQLGFANGGTTGTSRATGLDALTDATSGSAGHVLTTDGTNATWQAAATGVSSWSGGSTGLTPAGVTPGAIVLGGALKVPSGGTGLSTLATPADDGAILYYDGTISTDILQKLPTTGKTAGDYLVLDASLKPIWSTISPSLGGSGTVNYVTRFTASNVVGNSLLQDDGSNLAIGVTPYVGALLSVQGSSDRYSGYFSQGGSAAAGRSALYGIGDGTLNPLVDMRGVVGVARDSDTANYGVEGIANITNASATNVGGSFIAGNGLNNYAVRLADGSESAGYVLTCVDAAGNAEWQDISSNETGFSPYPIYSGTTALTTNARTQLTQATADATITINNVKIFDTGAGSAKEVCIGIYGGNLDTGVGTLKGSGYISATTTGVNIIAFEDLINISAGEDLVIYYSQQQPGCNSLGIVSGVTMAELGIGESGTYSNAPNASLALEMTTGTKVAGSGLNRDCMTFY